MKRMMALLMLVCTLLTACGVQNTKNQNSLTFYYLEKEYSYNGNSSVIASEIRDASGHRRDLSYLMALYLMGPTEEEHTMPLPAGTRIYGSELDNGSIMLQLSDAANSLSDSEFTLACACLSLTCFDFSDAGSVCVQVGERSTTLSRDSLTLLDRSEEYPVVEEIQ